MKPEIQITDHAKVEMERRKIPHEVVLEILEKPEQIVPIKTNRKIYQSRIDFGLGKTYLIRIVTEMVSNQLIVVTVYKTSKIKKYWLQG